MSTRSTTHFLSGRGGHVAAIVYRHSDGYPSGAGTDIYHFLREVKKLSDPRFNDPSYLAAKYVVWLGRMFAVDYDWSKPGAPKKPKESPLDFLSVGVCLVDPCDIEYRYAILCDGTRDEEGLPLVKCVNMSGDEVAIPRPDLS